jgi:hypothetical protein
MTGVGEQILARDAREGFRRERRLAGAGSEHRALQRTLSRCCFSSWSSLRITLFLALLHFVQRRLRDVDVPALDQFRHLPIEERQEQRADVRAVDVASVMMMMRW